MPDLVACSQCNREVNPRSTFCPFCGGRILSSDSWNDPFCPRCNIALEVNKKEDFDIDICPKCGGMWLDRGEFKVMTAESTVYREYELKKEYTRPSHDNDFRYIACVRCGKHMIRENFRKISGVIVDRCGNHGVWLDAGELEKIRHFIAAGGLDRSHDREIERNRQELKNLALTVKETAFSHRLIHFFNFKRWFFSGW